MLNFIQVSKKTRFLALVASADLKSLERLANILSDNISFTASIIAPSRSITRLFDILRTYRDLLLDPLALLIKASSSKFYKPRIYEKVISDFYRKMHWEIAMQKEVNSLTINKTWTLIDLSFNAYILKGR